MMWRLFIFAIFLASSYAEVVQIEQGAINGTILLSRNGTQFHAFFGIPYAVPPIGKLRFQAPRGPPPSWNGTRQASEPGSMCPQTDRFAEQGKVTIKGSEDCLFLNVFTHTFKPAKLAPVLVYIHGGGFSEGSGDLYGPQFLMDKNMVVVTVNSRLGIFGFLSSGDELISGNWGLKDQVAALKWIQKNIIAFGGDPGVVTLEGQSSGAASVHLHTFSGLSKGLFHRVIIQSGSALSPISYKSQSATKLKFNRILQCVGCNETSSKRILTCLRKMPMAKLQRVFTACKKNQNVSFMIAPVIENENITTAFLVEDPVDLHYKDKSIPAIISTTSNENMPMALRVILEHPNLTHAVLDQLLPALLRYENPEKPELTANITKEINRYYFPNDTTRVNPQALCNMMSDLTFKMWTVKTTHTYPGPKYSYVYDYNNRKTKNSRRYPSVVDKNICSGAVHSEDLFSLFLLKSTNSSAEDQRVSENLITYWVNFVTTGNPNVGETPVAPWEPAVDSNPNVYLHISKDGFISKDDITEGKQKLWEYIEANVPKDQKTI